MEMQPQETTRQRMTNLLERIASGQIEVAGFKKGDLNGKVLDLGDAPDGSLKRGDTLPFGDKGQANVIAVGTEEHDGHVIYQVYLTYPQ